MKTLDGFLTENEEVAKQKPKVCIDTFMDKILNCKTKEGCDELEKFYNKRKKEVEVSDSEDIQIRDAIRGRKEEIEAAHSDEEVEQEDL